MPKKQKKGRKTRADFYQTWQEAGAAAQKLGIRSLSEYNIRYTEDPKLPAGIYEFYGKDFPGIKKFLGDSYQPRNRSVKRHFYPSWKEAAQGAANLGIMSRRHYVGKYREDPWLPSQPWRQYQDFPGWDEFIRTVHQLREENAKKEGKIVKKDFYPTCKKASDAAQKLGIKSRREYLKRYKEDPRLPSTPSVKYKNFPGWEIFLGKDKEEGAEKGKAKDAKPKKDMPAQDTPKLDKPKLDKPKQKKIKRVKNYQTWQEAAKAVANLNITSMPEYQVRWKEDPKLPGNLYGSYKDFPGTEKFFSFAASVKKIETETETDQVEPEKAEASIYPTWQEAAEAAAELDIITPLEYRKSYSEDPQLPADPKADYEDFPGWDTFCQAAEKASTAQKSAPKKKGKKRIYQSWKAASRACRRLGITTRAEYLKRYKENPMLPSHPERSYRDWPGWSAFFNGERESRPRFPPRRKFYPTWQEAREACRRLDIRERKEYVIRYREDEFLNSKPERYYEDFPGWDIFLAPVGKDPAEKAAKPTKAKKPKKAVSKKATPKKAKPKAVEPADQPEKVEAEPGEKAKSKLDWFETLAEPLAAIEDWDGQLLTLPPNWVFVYSGVFKAVSDVMLDELLLQNARLQIIMSMHKVFGLNFCEANIRKIKDDYRLDISFANISGKGVNTNLVRLLGYPYSSILFTEVIQKVAEEDFSDFVFWECLVFTKR